METKLPTVFWHNVVTCVFLLCCLCQLADSKAAVNTSSCLQGKPGYLKHGGNQYQIIFSKKTYKDARSYCQGFKGDLAPWSEVSRWLTTTLHGRCPNNALKYELIWIQKKGTENCLATSNTLSTAEFAAQCNSKHIFMCKEAPVTTQSCLQGKSSYFKHGDTQYQIVFSKKTYKDAKAYCTGNKGKLAPWSKVSGWLTTTLQGQCPNNALISELIWVKGSATCSATSNTQSNAELDIKCDEEHIFMCIPPVNARTCLQGKSREFWYASNSYQIILSEKTYNDANSYCRGCHGELPSWTEVAYPFTVTLQSRCPDNALISETIWLKDANCTSKPNGRLYKRLSGQLCNDKHIFMCKRDSKTLCTELDRYHNIPSEKDGHFFRLYPERKTHDEAAKFCKDKKGELAKSLPTSDTLFEQLGDVYKTKKDQNLWIWSTRNKDNKCWSAHSRNLQRNVLKDCDDFYPFICEEARTTSSCLKSRRMLNPSFKDKSQNNQYTISLDKMTHAEAKLLCSARGHLADWKTSKDAVKDFLGSECRGPDLDEKIWFADCVVSLNTNLDATQKEDCNNKHLFVCQEV